MTPSTPLDESTHEPATLPPDATGDRTSPLFLAVVVLVIAAGIWHASSLATVNDDAFISFRYAQQLVRGNGLVYNPGERVEGYTNFLWTMLIAGGMSAGVDPVECSIVLGIAFFAGTLLLVSILSRRIRGETGGVLPIVPLAALALVLHRDAAVYATSGLETSMETFLVTAFFTVLVLRDDRRGHLAAGLVLTAALMTRPDAAVAVAAAIAFILLERKDALSRLAWVSLPLAALFLPYWIARWQYYGYFFPNAFYAKSIALPYYGQGWTYAWMYLTAYYPLVVVPALAAAGFLVARWKRTRRGANAPTPEEVPPPAAPGRNAGEATRRALRLGILLAGLHVLFVVRIGGDFMFARFFIPVTPVILVLLEIAIRTAPWRALGYALAILLTVGTLFRYDHFSAASQVGYIADEWQRYPLGSLEGTKHRGGTLRTYFDGLPVQAAFWGGQARLMFYADPYQAIETMTGLTDAAIAHGGIEERGRPGHEKNASEEYLVSRGVDFSFRPFPVPAGGTPLNLIAFDSIAARIVCYRNEVMDGLRKFPGVRFQPVPEYLDRYLSSLDEKSPAAVAADYSWFREYYFRHNRDEVREAAFEMFLERAGIFPPGG